MKKTLIAAALAISSSLATAATGFATYDYNSLNGASGTTQEVGVGVSVGTTVGTFDAVVIGNRYRLGAQDDTLGGEIGYSNGVKLLAGTITGRAALGRKNLRAGENTQYYSLSAEFAAPVTSAVGAFAGFRHRNAFNGTGSVENRYTVGADISLTKAMSVRAGYAHTVAGGQKFNGLVTAVSYKF